MASCDDPGDYNEMSERLDASENGTCASGERRPSRPIPDLGTSFPPSFTHDNPFVDGTPSGEVLLRVPRRDHIGEPAPTMNRDPNPVSGGPNKEIEQLRNEFSALSSSVQRSLETIVSRLETSETARRDVNDQRHFTRERSSSVPGPYPSRSTYDDFNNHTINEYSGRDRSVSPYNRSGDNYPAYSMTARSANVSSGNRPIDFIKVAVYEGKSSFKDYLGQFELAAFANRWDKQTSAVKLACSLRGSAAAILSDLTPEMKRDYDRLVKALTERFEPENQCEIYKAQIKQRIRKRDEPLTELAQDIKRLTRMAYPSAFLDLRDTLSKDCFIEALNDADMELFICQKEPETLDDAVRIALKYEAFSQGRKKRTASAKAGVRMQFEDDLPDLTLRDELREIKSELREMKNEKPNTQTVSENVHVPMQNGKQCYFCGDDRHLIRFCPFRDQANSYARAPTYNGGANRQNNGQMNVNRRPRYNSKKNQSTNRTDNRQQNDYTPNYPRNAGSENCRQLRTWVWPQL